jgi:hypothetical protein
MKLGFFGCAPVRPTLAVDINLLQFVSLGFLNMAPNVTGWARTIEDFLHVRGYIFRGTVRTTIFIDISGAMTDSHAGCVPKAIRQCAAVVSSPGTADEARGGLLGSFHVLRSPQSN